MKIRRFIRSFLFLFASISVVVLTADIFYSNNDPQKNFDRDARLLWQGFSPTVDIERLHTMGVDTLSIKDLSWPESLVSDLKKEGYVILPQDDGTRIFHGLIAGSDQVLIKQLPKEPQHLPQWAWWLIFYGALAAAIGGWFVPWFLDIHRLQKAAIAFSRTRHYMPVETSPSSPLQPVSNALNMMTDRIGRLMNLQRDIATFALHDIRTPLSRIRFACELLDDPKAQSLKKDIRAEIEEVETLLSELLNYAAFEYQNPNLHIATHQLAPFIESESEKFSAISAIQIDLKLTSQLTLDFDQTLLARALANLIGNCLRYATKQIRISTKLHNGITEIVVEDDGPGISTDKLPEITAPFVRQANQEDNNSDENNSGLGLAIVETVCRWHGFELTVENSAILGGARFTISSPSHHE